MKKALVALATLLACGSAQAKPLAPGAKPPDYLGETLAGQDVHVSALRGKVVVISFWATWCEYCMQELPVLGNLQTVATQRGLPLQVVEINYEQSHAIFVRASKLLHSKMPGLLVTWDRNGSLSGSFGLGDAGLPQMIMLHRDGSIAEIDIGYDKSAIDTIVAEINTLMAEPAPAPPPLAGAQADHPAPASAGRR